MKFYRYEDDNQRGFKRIRCLIFNKVKDTPKGYWIKEEGAYDFEDPHWVSKDGRKRYAYPTRKEAFFSFKKRKMRQKSIIEAQLIRVNAILRAIGRISDDNLEELDPKKYTIKNSYL